VFAVATIQIDDKRAHGGSDNFVPCHVIKSKSFRSVANDVSEMVRIGDSRECERDGRAGEQERRLVSIQHRDS